MDALVARIEALQARAALGGGPERIAAEHGKGKLTARERLALLFDADEDPLEVGGLAGEGMYAEHGGCPAGGVVVAIGRVHGRPIVAVANDATVKAGAWFPITGKKTCAPKKSPSKTGCPSSTS